MATKRYLSSLIVTIDGVSQVELQDATVTLDPKKNPVNTKNGFAGFSQGAKVITIEFKAAVPVSGPEFDVVEACEGSQQYTLAVPYGPKQIVTEGEFTGGSLSGSVDNATEISASFMGTYTKPK